MALPTSEYRADLALNLLELLRSTGIGNELLLVYLPESCLGKLPELIRLFGVAWSMIQVGIGGITG